MWCGNHVKKMIGGLEHFLIFPYIGNSHPNWLIFFRGVETTNQNCSMKKSQNPNPAFRGPCFFSAARTSFDASDVSRGKTVDDGRKRLVVTLSQRWQWQIQYLIYRWFPIKTSVDRRFCGMLNYLRVNSYETIFFWMNSDPRCRGPCFPFKSQ